MNTLVKLVPELDGKLHDVLEIFRLVAARCRLRGRTRFSLSFHLLPVGASLASFGALSHKSSRPDLENDTEEEVREGPCDIR